MAFVSSFNAMTVSLGKHKWKLERGCYPSNVITSLRFNKIGGGVRRRKATTALRIVAANQNIDCRPQDWIKHYQEDFESRFNLPHLRDDFDIEPMPTTFSLKNRCIL